MGLGLAALGRPGYINLGHSSDLASDYSIESMQRRTHDVLDEAWQAGIRYFDVARSYGKAEMFLASWLAQRDIDPADATVASKWGYTYTADWHVKLPAGQSHEVKQHSLERLNAQLQESEQLLGNQLDLYQIHSATLESGVLENLEVLARLAELRDRGVSIGLSVSGPNQAVAVRKALECESGGKQVFSAVQATWNLLEPSVGDALQAASETGWRVIVKEGVANGRLTDRNKAEDFASKRGLLQTFAENLNSTIDAVSLAAIVAQPWSSTILSGAATREQIRSNAVAISLADQCSLEEWSSLAEQLAETPIQYWSCRSSLDWN